ncbi:sensor histidine kinase [Paenibacillus turpanensis]|uniref:sensor histidine kinase n=1 Tax=Paenibacillus turpanensis TaxID=2689078 RepID=UPI001409C30D|nr:GHKL domain-containing protein [Paenibacillus turpanensis]
MLTDQLSNETQSVAEQIRLSIEQSEEGSFYVEDLVGQQLRAAAIAAKGELPPKLEDVTNERLEKLAEKVGVDDITLLQRVGDDIVALRSSEPKEIGLSTKDFGYWFTAFNQLLDHHNVTIPEGQKLPNFWAGIFEVAASDTESINKFGYYHDGTTDYIINPFVKAETIVRYKKLTGPERTVAKTLSTNSNILEITGFNGNTFGKEIPIYNGADGSEFISVYDQPIMFGSNEFYSEADLQFVMKALKNGSTYSHVEKVAGRHVLKTYLPVPNQMKQAPEQREKPFVIGVVSDYNAIQSTLNRELVRISVMALIATIFSVIVFVTTSRLIAQNREKAVRTTQELYIEDVDNMFSVIRGQRHDFLNHVQTIFSFVSAGKYDALKRYVAELVEDVQQVNEMIQIGHPGLAALIQAKEAIALQRKIKLDYEFHSMETLSLGIKSVDVVKIMGNLLDNAYDEVMKLPPDQRVVSIKGWVHLNQLWFVVTNPLSQPMETLQRESLFRSGFSTKSGDHQGLGLALVKQRVEAYSGSINVEVDDQQIEFEVRIPIEKKMLENS